MNEQELYKNAFSVGIVMMLLGVFIICGCLGVALLSN